MKRNDLQVRYPMEGRIPAVLDRDETGYGKRFSSLLTYSITGRDVHNRDWQHDLTDFGKGTLCCDNAATLPRHLHFSAQATVISNRPTTGKRPSSADLTPGTLMHVWWLLATDEQGPILAMDMMLIACRHADPVLIPTAVLANLPSEGPWPFPLIRPTDV